MDNVAGIVDENPKAKSRQRAAMLFSMARRQWDTLIGVLQQHGPLTERQIAELAKLHPRLVNAALWLGAKQKLFIVRGERPKDRTYEARQVGLPLT